tara:strand:+ start:17185 stop:17538 length:354 start_codon:yes stop_codon:yes gene_type:complete
MTKSRLLSEIPELNRESNVLLDTLSGLCSFYSVSDLASFLFSKKFCDLVEYKDPWIMFEIGVYINHNLTLDLIPDDGKLILIDSQGNRGLNSDSVEIISEVNFTDVMTDWLERVINC